MIDLRTALHQLLKQYHSQVYFMQAPDTATFPYVVYDLPNSFTDEQQEIFNLDIDIWDHSTDTKALETLTNQLWKGLDGHRHIDSKLQFSLYRENRLTLTDDDSSIKRRKLIFQLRYFDRN